MIRKTFSQSRAASLRVYLGKTICWAKLLLLTMLRITNAVLREVHWAIPLHISTFRKDVISLVQFNKDRTAITDLIPGYHLFF